MERRDKWDCMILWLLTSSEGLSRHVKFCSGQTDEQSELYEQTCTNNEIYVLSDRRPSGLLLY